MPWVLVRAEVTWKGLGRSQEKKPHCAQVNLKPHLHQTWVKQESVDKHSIISTICVTLTKSELSQVLLSNSVL